MTRDEALQLVHKYVKTDNSVKHMLATEAIMRALARHFGEDSKSSDGVNEEKWGLAGLVHDIDMEEVDYRNEPTKHGPRSIEILKENGLTDEEILNAVLAHNEALGGERGTKIEKAIHSVDPLTGLIVAATLVLPSRKLADVTVENILNRFKEKHFARGANREIIARCEELGLSLKEFCKIGLEAMQGISDELGL
ncbi:HD domain-containing protein [Patescibacteria group bacterium]|nr:HD domain-containing protein [Patescibacteria group bacterium]MBU4512176.1 HD domain-containing protein [Patescibacteria group bacterium]MCG2692742.1 HD domain-containing protein [Candidatus Parcubacteria bacterium]